MHKEIIDISFEKIKYYARGTNEVPGKDGYKIRKKETLKF